MVWRVARWREAGGGDDGGDDGARSQILHPLTAALPEAQPHFQLSVMAGKTRYVIHHDKCKTGVTVGQELGLGCLLLFYFGGH